MITVIVPTLNERTHVGGVIESTLSDSGSEDFEVIVADGGSTDGTREYVAEFVARDPRVKCIHNPKRTQAAAVNLAAAHADRRSNILVRLDAHAIYPPDFVSSVTKVLEETGADSVVVRLLSSGQSCFDKAVAAVSNSFVGTGGSKHRVGGVSQWIDHGHHAGFRRASFERIGGYDEDFQANEDAEFDARLRKGGGKIWFAAELSITYFPRGTPFSLAQQYFRNGQGRARNFRKNQERLKLRQVITPALLVAVLASIAAVPLLGLLPLTLPAAYLGLASLVSVILSVRNRELCLLGAAIALPVMHFSWGAGFLSSILTNQLAISVHSADVEPQTFEGARHMDTGA